jgi:hypothetical protein
MKIKIWMFACAFVAACATGQPPDSAETGTSASELSAPVMLSAHPGDGAAEINAQAIAESAAACHGTTTCPGGVFINGPFIVDCGPLACGGPACPARNPIGTQRVQPREHYTAYAVGSSVCLAYAPSTPRVLVPAQCGGLSCPL